MNRHILANKYIFLLLLALFNSCHKTGDDIEEFNLIPKKIIFHDKNSRNYELKYSKDGLKTIIISTEKSKFKRYLRFVRNKKGLITAIESFPFGEEIQYKYSYKNNLLAIFSYKNKMRQYFVYNNKGQIVKQINYFNKKVFSTITFYYENNCPVKSKFQFFRTDSSFSYKFTYSNIKNPFAGLSMEINQYELRYGYPIGNFYLLPDSVFLISEGKELVEKNSCKLNKYSYPLTLNDEISIKY